MHEHKEAYTHFEVSVKMALYAPDAHAAILMSYRAGGYGLPGGHIDAGETIEQAVQRELVEEIGHTVQSVRPIGFFMTNSGKIILGYTGYFDPMLLLSAEESAKESPIWMERADVETCEMDQTYKQFVLEHWPAA